MILEIKDEKVGLKIVTLAGFLGVSEEKAVEYAITMAATYATMIGMREGLLKSETDQETDQEPMEGG
jgi:hypothetical protein